MKTADFNNQRSFLKLGGVGMAALALGGVGSVNKTMAAGSSAAVVQQQTINLGSGDIGIGNFAFLLEQLEADFYTRVVASGFFRVQPPRDYA